MKQVLRFFGVFCGAILLSACGNSETPVIGATPAADPAQVVQTVKSTDPTASDIVCPKIEQRTGTETLRSFEVGTPGTPADLKWQANLTSMARECSILGVEVGIKTALSGRVILGPKGKAGNFTVPVRVAVVRKGSEALWSRVANVDVTVPAGSASGLFTLVIDDILFPREATDTLADVQVFVGFDPEVPKSSKKAKS
ncbi:MAG: hypothetical protein V4691_08895 [Pseudomonadota bacterium]